MFKGVYAGKYAHIQSKKILILGESHYDKNEDSNFTTRSVLENYYNSPSEDKYAFFHKIAKTCGIDVVSIDEEFEILWNRVYFGNYVEQLCGINNSLAKQFVKSNRWQYNNHLFEFINQNQIDIVLVFGRLSFDNMPSLSRREEKLDDLNENTLYVGNKRDWISHCKYLPNIEHDFTNVKLNKQVEVFNFRHPSAPCGFCVENYRPYIEKIFV